MYIVTPNGVARTEAGAVEDAVFCSVAQQTGPSHARNVILPVINSRTRETSGEGGGGVSGSKGRGGIAKEAGRTTTAGVWSGEQQQRGRRNSIGGKQWQWRRG